MHASVRMDTLVIFVISLTAQVILTAMRLLAKDIVCLEETVELQCATANLDGKELIVVPVSHALVVQLTLLALDLMTVTALEQQ